MSESTENAAPVAPAPSIESFAEKTGVLISRVAYPVVIEYGEGHLRVSPRTVTGSLIRRLLPDRLPAGLTFVAR